MTHFTQDGTRLLVSDLGADKIYVMEVDTLTKKIAPRPLFVFTSTPGGGSLGISVWIKMKKCFMYYKNYPILL